MNFKEIHIGELLFKVVKERQVSESRILNHLKFDVDDLVEMYNSKSIDTILLLKWSKLLEYDFFRVYTQHLILYSPMSNKYLKPNSKKPKTPKFNKNIYTREIIDFVLEKIQNEEMTKTQVINDYRIPKTTLYNWISKYKENDDK